MIKVPIKYPTRLPAKLHPLYGHWSDSRYFLTFPGVNQQVSIPEVTPTGDFEIECDFYRTSGFGGQALVANYDTAISSAGANLYSTGDYGSGAGKVVMFGFANTPEVTGLSVNKLYNVRFEYVSATNIASAYLDGNLVSSKVVTPPQGLATSNTAAIGFQFSGVIANVRISDNGTPVRFYPLDDNSTTIQDTIGGNNGTYINGAAADWGRFERTYGGDWQGQGLTVPPWASADQVLEVA